MPDSLLDKLNKLPKDVKDNLSLPDVLRSLEELETVYEIKPTKYLVALLLNEITPEQIGSSVGADHGNLNPIQLHNISMIFAELLGRIKAAPAKKAPPAAKENANLVMSISDDAEVKSMPSYHEEKVNSDEYAAKAKAIMAAFKFSQSDAVMAKRLENIIIARLRDVRDELETIENLTKSGKIGGMGFTAEQADALIKLIKNGFPVAAAKPSYEAAKEIENFKNQENKAISDAQINGKNNGIRPQPASAAPAPVKTPAMPAKIPSSGTAERIAAKVQPAIVKPAPAPAKTDLPMPLEDLQPTIVMEGGLPVIKMPNEIEDARLRPASGGTTAGKQDTRYKVQDTKNIQPTQPVDRNIKSNTQDVRKEEGKSLPITPTDDKMNKPVSPSQDVSKPKPILNIEYSISDNNKRIDEVKIDRPKDKEIGKTNTKLPPPKPEPYISNSKIPEKIINAPAGRRPTLDDVKFIKKTVGPIDELMQLTLIEFRRLSSDPREAVKKIKEKINLLERESYNKRNEGIAAWNKNEINRFYRLLGQACMSEGKGIEAVIKERLLAGKPTLSLQEFDAVMELNRELRY